MQQQCKESKHFTLKNFQQHIPHVYIPNFYYVWVGTGSQPDRNLQESTPDRNSDSDSDSTVQLSHSFSASNKCAPMWGFKDKDVFVAIEEIFGVFIS